MHDAPTQRPPWVSPTLRGLAGEWQSESPLVNRWLWLLAVAIALHAYLAGVPVEKFVFLTAEPAKTTPVPVELLDMKRRPVVMTERSPVEPTKDDGKPAEYEGEFRNRTDRQTRAENSGQFREFRSGRSGEAGRARRAERGVAGSGDVDASRIAALGLADLMPQSAASPHALPDSIAAGVRTVLNTDAVAHAGFLNRISSAIYDGWVSNARMAVERLRAEGKLLQSNVYVTKVAVELDTDGNLREVRVVESSGIPLLDDAPKRAFWDAQPFLHPPKALFRGEPSTTLVYEFHFDWKTSGFSLGGRAY